MPQFLYSPSLHTFLVEGVHPEIPSDSVSLTYQEYLTLLSEQAQGLQVVFDAVLGKPVALAPVASQEQQLAALHQQRVTDINAACEAAITAGFWSQALGLPHQYSSQLDDQLNLTGAILRGLDMPYACRDEQGVKAFRLHTAEQLRQVGDDFTLYKLQLLQHANELKQQLDQALAAGDAEAMLAITWEGAGS